MTDSVRRAREGTCSDAYCDQLPGLGTPAPGLVHQAGAGTHSGAFSLVLHAGSAPPLERASTSVGLGVHTGSDPASGCTRFTNEFFLGPRLTVGFRGTLTVRAEPDVNQWTHYDVPFDITAPWSMVANSNFCTP